MKLTLREGNLTTVFGAETGASNYAVRQEIKKGPEAYYNSFKKGFECGPVDAYRQTVYQFMDPLYKGFSFCHRGKDGKFITTASDGQVVSGPSDSEVKNSERIITDHLFND